MRNHLLSAIQFLMVCAVLAVGIFFTALPLAPAIRFELASFLMNRPELFLSLGLILIAVGVALAMGLYWLDRKSYFQVSMKGASDPVTVEKELIRSGLASYWKGVFPEEALQTDVIIHRDNKLELVAEIPLLGEEGQKKVLEKMEKEIGLLLERQLGYRREFLLTVIVK